MKRSFIFVGAGVEKSDVNAGGQTTASIGIHSYAKRNSIFLHVLDTRQNSFPVPPFKERLIKGVDRVKQAFCIIRDDKIDGAIIFSGAGFSFYERIFTTLLCRFYRVPTLILIRDGFFFKQLESKFSRLLICNLLRIPTYIGVQGGKWNILFDELAIKKNKVVTIKNWLPEHVEIQDEKVFEKDFVTFCFVGWVVKEKGIIELLSAVNSLVSSGFRLKTKIIGDGWLMSDCQDFVRRNNLKEFVDFFGWLEYKQVAMELSSSDVFVLPTYAEGFPNSLLEAMASGLPAISTDVGGISGSLLHGQNGYIAAVGSEKELQHYMKKYIESPELISEHSKETLKIVRENHQREANCKKIFDLFL
ncbi:glycosyltransferase [Porticoccus sp. GXU_MW_L64]